MQWYEADVREVERSIAARGLSYPIAFYGSSSIRLWSTLTEDIGPGDVLNLGFGGSTLEACAYFFERIVGAAAPCSLVVYAGDNDLGDGRSVSQVLGDFRDLAAKVALLTTPSGSPISFGFVSIKPSPARYTIIDRIRETNTSIATDIARIPNAFYVDMFASMLRADGSPRAELYQSDGLHLNEAGYRLWSQHMAFYRPRLFTDDYYRFHPRE